MRPALDRVDMLEIHVQKIAYKLQEVSKRLASLEQHKSPDDVKLGSGWAYDQHRKDKQDLS